MVSPLENGCNINFPPYLKVEDGEKDSVWITRYLKSLLELHLNDSAKKTIQLPGLMALADFFKAGVMDVHEAFQTLRTFHYDYFLENLEAPISFWRTSSVEVHKSRSGREKVFLEPSHYMTPKND